MKLTRKILKFAEPLTYRRGWRRAQRSIFRVPLGPMLAQIDRDRAREIQQRYTNSTAGYAKYANIEPWLRLNRERVQDLKLHRSAPKRVLDLGCGGGFFLFILKRLVILSSASTWPRFLSSPSYSNFSAFRAWFGGLTHSSRCPISVKSSTGSPRSRSILISTTHRNNAGDQLSGIFSCAICSGTSPRAAKFFLGSTLFSMEIIIRLSCAIFF